MTYSPNFQRSSYKKVSAWDKLSDHFLGTNKQAETNAYNQETANQTAAANSYELQKAVNINKYSWNQQGMLAAGINPLAAQGAIGNVSSGPSVGAASAPSTGDLGAILGSVTDMLHEISPANVMREMKSFARSKLFNSF